MDLYGKNPDKTQPNGIVYNDLETVNQNHSSDYAGARK